MPRQSHTRLPGFTGYSIQCCINPVPIQARTNQSLFPPGIKVKEGMVAGTQVFAQTAVYYAIDAYTPMAYIVL